MNSLSKKKMYIFDCLGLQGLDSIPPMLISDDDGVGMEVSVRAGNMMNNN